MRVVDVLGKFSCGADRVLAASGTESRDDCEDKLSPSIEFVSVWRCWLEGDDVNVDNGCRCGCCMLSSEYDGGGGRQYSDVMTAAWYGGGMSSGMRDSWITRQRRADLNSAGRVSSMVGLRKDHWTRCVVLSILLNSFNVCFKLLSNLKFWDCIVSHGSWLFILYFGKFTFFMRRTNEACRRLVQKLSRAGISRSTSGYHIDISAERAAREKATEHAMHIIIKTNM